MHARGVNHDTVIFLDTNVISCDTFTISIVIFLCRVICTRRLEGSPKKKGEGKKKGALDLEGPATLVYPVSNCICPANLTPQRACCDID